MTIDFNMATVRTFKNGGVVRWDQDDWFAGLTPDWGLNETETTLGKGFSTMTGIDPFRRPGYLAPAADPLNATNNSVIDAMQLNGVVYGTNAYTVGGTKIHELAILTSTLTNGATFPHTTSAHGGHNSLALYDICIYYIGTTRYAFYSWSDNTDGDVGRYDLASTFDDDYMSTVPASAAALDTTNPHPMVVGADDILYIADGHKLHKFDGQTGANGTLFKSRLTLPTDYIITSFAKTGDNLVIFAYKSSGSSGGSYYKSEATAFFWDYTSEDPWKVVPLQGNYVNGGFSFQGTIGCFVQGSSAILTSSSKQSRLLLYDGSIFKPVAGFIDNIPGYGGVEVYDNTIYWNAAGYIYQYGAPHIGIDRALNRITKLDGTSSEGMLRNFSNSRMMASAGTTTSGGMQRVNSGHYAGSIITPTVNIPFSKPAVARITAVKIFWYSTKTAGSNKISVKILTDRNQASATIIDTSGTVGSDRQSPPASLVNVWYDQYNATAFPTTCSMALYAYYTEVDPTLLPAIIQAVEVYYEYENISP